MSDYHISPILPSDKRGMRQVKQLLEKETITLDRNLDYTVGLFDEDYNLAATGSCYGNTLRCMAVDSTRQGEGLLNQLLSHLMDYQSRRGNIGLFLYTKCDKSKFFGDLGFYEIASVQGKVVFMENRKHGFRDYLAQLASETPVNAGRSGAIIMNANPFTLGHQYLVETAAAACDQLHVFVVSEDTSLVPFTIRYRLVQEGTAHLSNIVYHQTGSYMISNATFPSYFLKDEQTVITSQARLDIEIFIRIANALGITERFVGEEPFSQVTGIYNRIMKEKLEEAGLACTIIPRKAVGAEVISASMVRSYIQEGNLEAMKHFVPASTYRYFLSEEAQGVIAAIKGCGNVIHY